MDGWMDGGNVHGYRERKEEKEKGKMGKEKRCLEQTTSRTHDDCMIDCMNDEQDSSEDERCFFAPHLAIAAGFDLSLNSLRSLGVSIEFKEEEERQPAGIERASLGIGFLSFYCRLSLLLSFSLLFLLCMHVYNLLILPL